MITFYVKFLVYLNSSYILRCNVSSLMKIYSGNYGNSQTPTKVDVKCCLCVLVAMLSPGDVSN